jgi:tRNA (mo5U34)-methyltransferase
MPAHDAEDVVSDPSAPPSTYINLRLRPFDQPHYRQINQARAQTIRNVTARLAPLLQLHTAMDAGAGLGFFSQTLFECGLQVRGFDGREENTVESRRRFPHIRFDQGDLQDRGILDLGQFDLVLCFGLLYHLENPLLAVRHLRALTKKCLLLESMCVPDEKPSLLLREEPREDDQSLTDVAYYPSEGSLIKMLYRAGYAFVYRVAPLPDHDDFRDTREHRRKRTVLLASAAPVDLFGFRLCPEDREARDPWTKKQNRSSASSFTDRLRRFIALPTRKKYFAMVNRVRRIFPQLSIPWRLEFGAWWLAEQGELDEKLLNGGFEKTELRFVEKLLRPGMIVLDIGAHHGLYSLLASKVVGRKGRVIAIEPSPRERRRLARHLRVNRCSNVHIESCAIGSESGPAEFFVVNGACDWGNSLRAPLVLGSTHQVRVEVRSIDDVLHRLGINRVDFLKIDIEGAELEALRGAARLLRGPARPAMLIEVQDLRTQPWGHRARDIVEHLSSLEYRWFALAPDGSLHPISTALDSYDANLVALPYERTREFRQLLERKHLPGARFENRYGGRYQYRLEKSLGPNSERRQGVQLLKSMVRVRQG